jgi:hypothetical protein
MNELNRLLLDFFLFRNFTKTMRNWGKRTQDRLKKVKPFSWETALLLSLFSWFVYLLVQGFYAKKFVSVFAWAFLMLGVDWALLGRKIKVPLIGFQFQYGPWLTGAIASLAFFSNDFLIHNLRDALTSWPFFSALFASYSRFIQTGLRWKTPDAAGRQDLVLLFLVAALLSCWFQFQFLVQDVLTLYPNLRADKFDRSLFVTRVNPQPRPASQGFYLLAATEQAVRQDLAGKNWIEVQHWLDNVKTVEPDLGRRAISAVYGNRLPREQMLWQITVTLNSANSSSPNLNLRARWLGASSLRDGYTLIRACTIQESSAPPPQTFDALQKREAYQLVCQPARQE